MTGYYVPRHSKFCERRGTAHLLSPFIAAVSGQQRTRNSTSPSQGFQLLSSVMLIQKLHAFRHHRIVSAKQRTERQHQIIMATARLRA